MPRNGLTAWRRRCRPVAWVAGLSLFAAIVSGMPTAFAQDRAASLSARLTLRDLDGRTVASARNGEAFRLQVDLTDVATGKAPNGLELSGWIRRVDRLNGSCEDEARAFRVTRSIAQGAVDLNGAVVAVLNEDASVGIIDPKLDGQPATMLGAAALGRMPDDFAIDRANMRAVFSFGRDGVVEDVSLADGSRHVVAEGLDRPGRLAITPRGDLWVEEGGAVSRIREGRRAETVPVGSRRLVLLGQMQDTDLIGAVSADGGVALIDGATARVVFQGGTGAPVGAAAVIGDEGMLSLAPGADTAELRYFDDFDAAAKVPLGFAAERLAVSPDGRVALAFTPGQPGVAIVDIATARVVQTVELRNATVAEVGFTDRAAFLATSEGAYLAVLDLMSVGAGATPVMRPVPLGGEGGRSNGERRLLAAMSPSPQMLAVDRDRATGWIVPEIAAVGSIPPMGSILLPGGIPLQVHVVDRSFRETRAGRFETVARVADGGEHELVLTTGIAGMTTCIRFAVDGPVTAAATRLYRVSVKTAASGYRARTEQELEFVFSDEEGRALDVEAARFLVPSLVSPWSTEIVAHRDAGGRLKATVRFPHAGAYALQPLGMPQGWKLKSTPMIEVSS